MFFSYLVVQIRSIHILRLLSQLQRINIIRLLPLQPIRVLHRLHKLLLGLKLLIGIQVIRLIGISNILLAERRPVQAPVVFQLFGALDRVVV